MQKSLSTRIFAGFLAILVVFSGTALFVVSQLERIREDLRLVHRGHIGLARQATQVRTLQEAKEEYVRRSLTEADPDVRRHLTGYAREFYPRALRDRLREMETLATSLAVGAIPTDSKRFLEEVVERVRRVQRLHDAYDEATVRLLATVDSTPAELALESEEERELRDAELAIHREAYKETSEALSREVRALSLALETRIAEALLRSERLGREATYAAIGLSLVALAIGLGILVMMTRALRPLALLVESARAIRRGSLDVEVPFDRDDEVGELGREFNAMARALKDRERVLGSRNEELLRLKAFSDDVIRSVRIGIVILDQDGIVKDLNPAARSVFQLPLVDLEGRRLEQVEGLAGPLSAVLAEVRAVNDTGELRSFPLVRLKDRIVDVALVPVRDRAGASPGDVLLLGEDVTVREETREKLVRSERLAAIGRLAAQITHEIRNPLSSIGLNIELLGDDVEHLPRERQEEARQILDAVGREVARLTQITEGYLRYARLPDPAPAAGDVGDLLADLCAFNQSEAERAGVMLELQVEDGLPQVPHDPQRMRQALLNLLKNAQEAAGKGGTVRCSAKATAEGGVRVVVEDSGPGVPEEVRERLFEPFFTTKEKGTGLGLTLSREIVTEHGGALTLSRSSLGGAAFVVVLPPEGGKPPPTSEMERLGETITAVVEDD